MDSTELRKAYRRLALKHHPDQQGSDDEAREEAATRFKEVAHAHQVLQIHVEIEIERGRERPRERQREMFGVTATQ